jgi:hypothetical protein
MCPGRPACGRPRRYPPGPLCRGLQRSRRTDRVPADRATPLLPGPLSSGRHSCRSSRVRGDDPHLVQSTRWRADRLDVTGLAGRTATAVFTGSDHRGNDDATRGCRSPDRLVETRRGTPSRGRPGGDEGGGSSGMSANCSARSKECSQTESPSASIAATTAGWLQQPVSRERVDSMVAYNWPAGFTNESDRSWFRRPRVGNHESVVNRWYR